MWSGRKATVRPTWGYSALLPALAPRKVTFSVQSDGHSRLRSPLHMKYSCIIYNALQIAVVKEIEKYIFILFVQLQVYDRVLQFLVKS